MKENLKISIMTGLSILLALYIGRDMGIDSLFYASIAAAVVAQNSHKEVFKLGIKRIYGTVVGAVIGIFFYYYLPHEFYSYALGIGIITYICSSILKAPANMACIVFMAMSLNIRDVSVDYYAIHRILDTGIGVFSALSVAYIINLLEKKWRFF